MVDGDYVQALDDLTAQVQRAMNDRRDDWVHGSEDDVGVAFSAAFESLVPLDGSTVAALLTAHPDLLGLDSPGVIAETLEGVVRDSIMCAIEPRVIAWADDEYDAHDPSECVAEAEPSGRRGPTDG